jgi:hypothetical protein
MDLCYYSRRLLYYIYIYIWAMAGHCEDLACLLSSSKGLVFVACTVYKVYHLDFSMHSLARHNLAGAIPSYALARVSPHLAVRNSSTSMGGSSSALVNLLASSS